LLQSRPALQRSPVVQQDSPLPPQSAAQLLPTQEVVHVVLQLPQCRASLVSSTHVLLQQDSEPLHVVPPQQLWPVSPHAPTAVVHLLALHARPALQAVPLQQSWLAPPHGGGVTHWLLVHVKPDAHAFPPQHACRLPPHAAGAVQLPRSHTRPCLQVLLAQHA